MTSIQRCGVFLRLELAEAMRSRWVLLVGVVYALVFGAFVWLGLRESSVLGFTGMSRIILNVSNAVVIAVPLVALVATSQAIVGARCSGYFELMLTQPTRREDWLVGAVLSRLLVVVGPLVLSLLLAVIIAALGGAVEPTLVPMTLRCFAISTSLAWAFIGLGFWVSAVSRTAERATVLALLVWIGSVALHDFALIGVLLEMRVSPVVVFTLAALNPVEAARIATLTVVDPELSVLGPVGFWLANKLGHTAVLAVGIAWPAIVGTVAVYLAKRRLARSDLVG